MSSPDLPTLLLMLTLTTVALAASVLLVGWRGGAAPGLMLWGCGLLANALSYPAFGLRIVGWPITSVALTNLLTLATLALHLLALSRFQQGRAAVADARLIWALVLFGTLAAILLAEAHHARNVLVAALQCGLAGWLVWLAWAPRLEGHRASGRLLLMAGGLLLMATLALRVVLMSRHHDWNDPMLVPTLVQSLTYLSVLLVLLLNTTGFVLMQMEHALDQQQQAATHDALTGALNRRALSSVLAESVSASARKGRPLAVLMLDIDHFKRVNDDRGHAVGDEVLKALVLRTAVRLREHDQLARYGGEEFVVLLPDTGTDGALKLAERLRESIAATPIIAGDCSVPLTISIGVHARVPQAGEGSPAAIGERMLDAADHALFVAKRAGRNRVAMEA
jgi:diguanylate cyclase (GGDEF)-like protein